MKKKALAVILASVLTLSVSACGASSGSAEDSGSKTEASSESTSAETKSYSEEDGIIEFTDTILLDNDLVTVWLTQFFEKEVNWAGASAPQMEKYVMLKVHNNSDKEIMFNLKIGPE